MSPDPPDVDRLADLDADLAAGSPVDPRRLAAALADPAGRAVLDALAATRAELAALPPVPVPATVAARWSDAIAAARPATPPATSPRPGAMPDTTAPDTTAPDTTTPTTAASGTGSAGAAGLSTGSAGAAGPGTGRTVAPAPAPAPGPAARADRPPSDSRSPDSRPPDAPAPGGAPNDTGRASGTARPRGRRDRLPGRPPRGPGRLAGRTRPAVVLGLLLLVVLVVAGLGRTRNEPQSITAADLGGVARASVGQNGAGPLADPVRRAACLRITAPPGVAPGAPLFGGLPVRFAGTPGVLLVLGTGELGVFDVVVVDPGCGPDGGTLIAEARIGR